MGSTREKKCPPGSFDVTGGKGKCELCEAGKYTGLTNQVECTLCTESNWCADGNSLTPAAL